MRLDHDVVCFGKVPTYGDFVRYNADGAAARALDTWFREGLYRARTHLKRGLKTAAARSVPHRFVFCPTTAETLLIGVVQVSTDKTGRIYPFVVATERTRRHLTVDAVPHVPAGARDFLAQAGRLVRDAVAGDVTHGLLPDRLRDVDPDTVNRPEGITTAAHYLRRTTLKEFAEAIWDAFEDSRKYLLFKNLIDALAPLRGHVPARLSLGLRFPLRTLPRDDVTPVEAVVGAWLTAALRVLNAPSVAPTLFWRRAPQSASDLDVARGDAVPEGDAVAVARRAPDDGPANDGSPDASGRDRSLLLFFRPPPPSAFVQLLPVDVDDASICELETIGRSHAARAALSIPQHVGEALESETLFLDAFLNGL